MALLNQLIFTNEWPLEMDDVVTAFDTRAFLAVERMLGETWTPVLNDHASFQYACITRTMTADLNRCFSTMGCLCRTAASGSFGMSSGVPSSSHQILQT